MSDFSDAWAKCMQSNSMPIITLETVSEALEFVHKVHDAWENAGGGDEELLMGAFVASGALAFLGEDALAAFGEAAQIAVTAYLAACVSCMAKVAISDLISLNQQGQVPDFVVAQLDSQGVDLNTAVA